MNRLDLSKVFTHADRKLIREELFKEAEQISMPCSKNCQSYPWCFLHDNVDSHILPESGHYSKCKLSTKRIFIENEKTCARYNHHHTFFRDLFTIATDIAGGYITSVGNKRPLSAWDKFQMSCYRRNGANKIYQK